MKRENIGFCIIILILLIAGCVTENTQTYVLNVSVDPVEAGTVNPTNGEFEEGEEVSIEALENEYWVFDRWQGDVTGTQNPATITIERDLNATAMFVKKEYPLSITVNGEGEIQETVVQAKDYEHGTIVELNASPVDGWHFVGWSGDLNGSENPSQVTIDGETSVTANFEINTYPLSVEVDGSGSVDLSPDKQKYDHGEGVEVTANPSTGWDFSHWEGDFEGTENPSTYQVTKSSTVTAVFVKKTYQVNITSSDGGDVDVIVLSGERIDGRYTHNTEIEATAQPDDDSEFVRWEGDIESDSNPLVFNVNSNTSVNAVFNKLCTVPKDCVSANFYASVIVGEYVFGSHLNVFNSLESSITITEIYVRRGDGEFAAQSDDRSDEVAAGKSINYEIDYLPQPTVDQFSEFKATVFYKHNSKTYKLVKDATVSTFKEKPSSKTIKLQ